MLDKLSFQVMLELCRNGRASNAKIAQTLGISELTVAKKINTMIANDVFAIKAIPNPLKMGYQASAVIGLKVDLKHIDNICVQLADNIHINLLVTCFGRFDILLLVYFSEWQMLQSFIKDELPSFKGINHIDTYLISESKKRYRDKKAGDTINGKPVELDEIDQLLIKELMRDGNPNYTDLANKFSISISTISRRIANLLKAEVIEILAIPNPSKLGYSASAFAFLRVDLSKVNQICEKLSSYPEVHTVLTLMNDYDILFGVNSTDLEALYDFFKSKIAKIEGIVSTESLIRGYFLYFSSDAMFLPSWAEQASASRKSK